MTEVQGLIGIDKLPPTYTALSSLARIDYGDAFTRTIPPSVLDASAEAWARAALGDVPNFGEYLAWHVFLRQTLAKKASPTTIAGVRIGGRGEGWVRLESASWLMGVNIVVVKAADKVSFVTFLQHNSWVSRPWWRIISWIHRTAVPRLLRDGGKRLEKQA